MSGKSFERPVCMTDPSGVCHTSISLDGCIAGSGHTMSWTLDDRTSDPALAEILTTGAMLAGRWTCEVGKHDPTASPPRALQRRDVDASRMRSLQAGRRRDSKATPYKGLLPRARSNRTQASSPMRDGSFAFGVHDVAVLGEGGGYGTVGGSFGLITRPRVTVADCPGSAGKERRAWWSDLNAYEIQNHLDGTRRGESKPYDVLALRCRWTLCQTRSRSAATARSTSAS